MTNPTEAPMANAIDDVKLLPCPFCGGSNVFLRDYDPKQIWIECDDCQVGTLRTLGWPECRAAWNRRAPPAPSQHTGWSDEAVEAGVEAALKARIIPFEDDEDAGVRLHDYIDLSPADAIDLGVKLSEKKPDGSPRFHWYSDIRADEMDDVQRAILRPLVRAALTAASSIAPATGFEPQHIDIAHDGFSGDVIGDYTTREGKRGFVVQQDGTRVVHVYGEKFAGISPSVAKESGEP